MKKLAFVPALIASPALAASEEHAMPFMSLFNTNFVVIIAFLVFIGILLLAGVPKMILGVLDGRADGIRKDLAEAKALRDEAQALLDSFAKRRTEVEDLSRKIVDAAREEAQAAAEKGKADLADTIARRLKAAEDQIASAEAAAVKEVRDRAVQVAVAAAGDVIAKGLSAADAGKLIDASIEQVAAKLH
jgi:F-type H+-transporting ATPase subunit b